MAFAATTDYKIRSGSPSPFDRQSHHHQYRPSRHPGAPDLADDLDDLDEYSFDDDMISPVGGDERRDSFANSTQTIFTPQSAPWEDYTPTAMDRKHNISSEPIFVPNNNPFTRMDQPHIVSFGQQSTWPLVDRNADSRTPFDHAAPDVYAGEYEPTGAYMTVGSSAPPFSSMSMPNNVQPSSVFSPPTELETPVPQSPVGDQWMPDDSEVAKKLENRIPKRMSHHRNTSPSRTGTPTFINSNGVRKKNARFEIPLERNLTTIDALIADADGNDDLVRELKTQKRLLRNRQAAYVTVSYLVPCGRCPRPAGVFGSPIRVIC
jgi:hypothetical protein